MYRKYIIRGNDERVCAMYLRPKGEMPKAQHTVSTFLEKTPMSHKRYAFTAKVVSNTMLVFLEHTDNYYLNFMVSLLQAFPYIRNSIFTQEYDPTGRLHIHGVLTCSRNFDLSYKRLNDKFPGISVHLTMLNRPPSKKEDRPILPAQHKPVFDPCPPTNGYKHPNKWYKYMFTDTKEITIVAYNNLKLKSWVKDMTICHIKKDTENEDLDRAAKEAAAIFRLLPKLLP